MLGGLLFLAVFSIAFGLVVRYCWKREHEKAEILHHDQMESMRQAREKRQKDHERFMAEHKKFMERYIKECEF